MGGIVLILFGILAKKNEPGYNKQLISSVWKLMSHPVYDDIKKVWKYVVHSSSRLIPKNQQK